MIQVAKPSINDEEISEAVKVLKSGNLVSGTRVYEFEELFKKFVGTNYCVATNSGTSALHTTLQTLEIKKGDEVIVPSLTFFATIEAVLQCGAKPIFTDIDIDYWTMGFNQLRDVVTQKTKVAIPVHLFGLPVIDLPQIVDFSRFYRWPFKVIEDCAQAHGARLDNYSVGQFGDFGCWSFFSTKPMTTIEGGAITTNIENNTKLARKIINHGMSDRHTHEVLGYNYRMNELSAAIGIVQLKKLERLNSTRHHISLTIRERLKLISWLIPQKINWLHQKSAWFWLAFRIDEEKLGYSTQVLIKKLRKEGIEVRYRYTEPLYKQPIFNGEYETLDYPNVTKVAGKVIGLPNHPGLKEDEIDKIVDVIKKI